MIEFHLPLFLVCSTRKTSKSSLSSEAQREPSEVQQPQDTPTTTTTTQSDTPPRKPKLHPKPDISRDTPPLKPVVEEGGATTPTSNGKKESPYDHLPAETRPNEEGEEGGMVSPGKGAGSCPGSPSGSDGKRTPTEATEEFTNLDYIPRSSPTVQTRSITPEHAQHLRKLGESEGVGLTRGAATVRGRRSPPNNNAFKKSNTLGHINRNALKKISPPSQDPTLAPSAAGESDETLYNVPNNIPRPSSVHDVYKVPKSVLDSPPSKPRSNGMDDITYDTPKVSHATSNGHAHSGHAHSGTEGDIYKVPSSVPASENAGSETYDSPKSSRKASGQELDDDGVYHVPRSSSGGVASGNGSGVGEGLYNVPRTSHSNGSDAVYNTPRTVQSGSASSSVHTSPSRKNNYESIDLDEARVGGPAHSTTTLRPARSFESLHKFRVSPTDAYSHPTTITSGHISPPAHITRPKCEYVDIDLVDGRPLIPSVPAPSSQAPAKHAPLPPLPKPAGPDRVIVESVYAEISEDQLQSRAMRQNKSTGSLESTGHTSSHTRSASHAIYNELPSGPARPAYKDSTPSLAAGMAKAKELAEEEGYEFCLPASEHLRRNPVDMPSPSQAMGQGVNSAHPTGTQQASVLMEKYNINIHDSTVRSRPYSESDVLEGEGSVGGVKLSSSTPQDSDLQSDEYVIVTGPDRRPKTYATPTTHTLPAEDEYETMTSARINLPAAAMTQYSTPDPSLTYNSSTTSAVPQPSQQAPPSFARRPSPGRLAGVLDRDGGVSGGDATPPLPPRPLSLEYEAGIDLDMMSPADPNTAYPQNHSQQHRQLSTSLSSSSGASGSMEGEAEGEREEEGQQVSDLYQIPASHHKAAKVKIMEGSPLDRTYSDDLK